ncbi:hypothetical protein NPIL_259841 [Nephila pilipes]|uniref:Uncharacterized protein n=1 Tax=Nephila pilipes TaxID=299642 RepID=A0A8X6MYY4_NEPPI|nr:hypothetical protein NPIL_259841 [Nephila pilipes]
MSELACLEDVKGIKSDIWCSSGLAGGCISDRKTRLLCPSIDLDISIKKQHSSRLSLKTLPNPSDAYGLRTMEKLNSKEMEIKDDSRSSKSSISSVSTNLFDTNST